MGSCRLTGCLAMLLLAAMTVSGQNQPTYDNFQFYMDSNADCNSPVRDIGNQRAYVYGKGANQQQQGPLKCILTLRSQTAFNTNRLRLEIAAMSIQDAFVTFTIYDGSEGQILLMSFDKNTLPDTGNSREFITTGAMVTFILERRDAENTKYNIQMVVSPVILGSPSYENNYGNDYGYSYKMISMSSVVAIVGSIFAVIVIVVVIISVYCYRKQRGLTGRWKEHKMTYIQTPASLPNVSSEKVVSEADSSVWASEGSRGYDRRQRPVHPEPPRSRMAYPSEDEDSVFDDSMDRRRYRDPPPPKYSSYRRYPKYAPPRTSQRPRDTKDGFIQADDDHPQNTYIERVIEPRVKPSRQPITSPANQAARTVGTGPDDAEEPAESDPEDQEQEEEEKEVEQETEEEDEPSDDEKEEPPKPVRPIPSKLPRKSVAQPQQSVPVSHALPPAADPPQQPVVYQPQFMPVAYHGMLPHFQPIAIPGMAPQQPPAAPAVQTTQPPIYSYLVQRGYMPMDGRNSPDSVSTGASARSNTRLLQDIGRERIGGVDSGVELMRR